MVFLFMINLAGSFIPQTLMWAFIVIKLHIFSDPFSCFPRITVIFQIKILIFQTSPKPFYEDIVICASTVIHTDFGTCLQKEFCIVWAGKMASLIAVHDFRYRATKRLLAGIQNKFDFQSVIYLPCQNIPAIPVYNGSEIKPALLYRNIRNINTSNMIWKGSLYPIEKIGIYFIGRVRFTGVLAWVNGLYPHFSHSGKHCFFIYMKTIITVQPCCNTAISKFRMLCVGSINQAIKLQIPFRRRVRLIIQGSAVQTQHFH